MSLSDPEWNRFLGELKKKKCCLLMGPEINCIGAAGEQRTVMQAFSRYMEKRLQEEQIEYDKSIDSFYYRAHKFIAKKYPDRVFLFKDEIEQFSNESLNVLPEYFKKLVKLPFNSIVSMTPDSFIGNTLRDGGL